MADTTKIAGRLVSDLMAELDLTRDQALGLVGNLAHESQGFRDLTENGGSGYGYAQWTGPRRKEYLSYAKSQGLKPSSYEANKGFIVQELKSKERGALRQIKGAQTADEAATVAMKSYFRPGVPHLDRRLEYTNQFAAIAPNSALAAIDTTAPTVPARRPDSLSAYQPTLAPPTKVRTVAIDPLTGFPPKQSALDTVRTVGQAARSAAAPPPRAAWVGDGGPAAMSVTSRLGNDLTNFSDAVAAPTYGDYGAARDLAARRYSTALPPQPQSIAQRNNGNAPAGLMKLSVPSVPQAPNQLAGSTQMPRSVRPQVMVAGVDGNKLTPTVQPGMMGRGQPSTAPVAPPIPARRPSAPATSAPWTSNNLQMAAIRNAEQPQFRVGTGPTGNQLTPNATAYAASGASYPFGYSPYDQNAAVAAIKNAAPTIPRGMPIHNRSRDSLAYAQAGKNAVANMPPVTGNLGGVIDMTASNPSARGAQGIADSQGKPIRVGNTIYYPNGRVPTQAVANQPKPQRSGGLFGGLFGGGNSGGGIFGGLLGGGMPSGSSAITAPGGGGAFVSSASSQPASSPLSGVGGENSLLPAALNNDRWRTGY